MGNILQNINVLITRAEGQANETVMQLEQLGAKVLSFPTINISTITGDDDLDSTIRNINLFNSLIFTSANAVKSFMEKITELKITFNPKAYFVISIGEKTSLECSKYDFRIDFQSKIFSSNSLVEELGFIDLVGRKILIPCSNLANPNQFEILEEHGAELQSIPVYSNSVNIKDNLSIEIDVLEKDQIDLFIFTSPSTFNGFLDIMDIKDPRKYFKNKTTAVIGPVTNEALANVGIKADIIPQNFTMNNLINTIKEYYTQKTIIS